MYGHINYGSTYKTNLDPIDKAQRRIFRAIFYRRQWDTLQDVHMKHKPKAYNWLSLLNLIPPELRNLTAEQVNKIVRNINEVYVIDNQELFELFF